MRPVLISPSIVLISPTWECQACDQQFSSWEPAPDCPRCGAGSLDKPEVNMKTLEEILGTTLAAQVRLVPQPPDVRGHILAKLNVWVPAEANVEEWVVANCQPRVVTTAPAPAPVSPPPPNLLNTEYEVECWEEGTETGSCRFSRSYRATGTLRVTERQMRDFIQENNGDRDDVIDEFADWVSDRRVSDDWEHGDEDYDDHDVNDSDVDDCGTNAREVMERYLDAHPELLRQEDGDAPDEDDEQPMPF